VSRGTGAGTADAAFDAVVLAGGEGRRLGGVSKPEVLVDGRAMLDRVLDATEGARRVVVVGPARLARPGVLTVLEDPPSGGPVAGLDAGMAALGEDGASRVLVLACDVPLVAEAVPALLAALPNGMPQERAHRDGARLVDGEGRGQPLAAVYRAAALRDALARCRARGGVHGASVRGLVADLRWVDVPDVDGAGADGDTWEAVAHLEDVITRRRTMADETVPEVPGQRVPTPVGKGVPTPRHQPVGSDLHRWVATLVDELGVDPDAMDLEAVLDLARETAHGVARPAVPLTAFMVGHAVAREGGDRAAFDRVSAKVTALAREWAARREVEG
jgi:molybdopterin-guanine dinucleotide biosynthesis protein A